MPRFSRRSFLHFSAAASAAAVFPPFTESMLAQAARPRMPEPPPGAVVIDANENPLGPCQSARDAMAAVLPQGGRYQSYLTDDLIKTYAQVEGVKPEYIRVTAGSTPALSLAVLAFTSPQRSYVTADPSFELGIMMTERSRARLVKVPLTKTYAHDVRAMLSEAPDGGLFYICNPNNPTGTLTSHAEIEYLVANKPKDAIVMVDEAYIHFTEKAESALDLVKADKDVVVLRTFSKVYGMAGVRCGVTIARPDLLNKILERGGWNFMPVTAVVAASASLKDAQMVPERRASNAGVRQQCFDWLDRNGYTYIPSESNCFMVDVKRPGRQLQEAMAKQNVFIGRTWPVMPNWVRITVGTQDEMDKFQVAFQRVMKA
jgi:histidinol-phosphate aminotransferase